jgi:uncharacterized protein (TIGR00369 family)
VIASPSQPRNASTKVSIELARQVLAGQPFSMLLGARITEYGPSGVTLELDARPDLRQQHGYVQGGVLSYLIDNAITFAAGAALGPDIVTVAISVEYLRPATTDLSARAWVEHAGSSRAVVRCNVTTRAADKSVLCALGQGSVMARRVPAVDAAVDKR